MSLAKRWCFTLQTPTDDEQFLVATLGESILLDEAPPSDLSYLVYGREICPTSGRPHLQGYLCLTQRKRMSFLKTLPGLSRCHWEVQKASKPEQAITYCKKDGDFDEYGEPPVASGTASCFKDLRDWVADQNPAPTMRDIWDAFPHMAGRYKGACIELIDLYGQQPPLVEGPLRPWQSNLNDRVSEPADDRTIIFVVDETGNSGKSWLMSYWLSWRPGTQFLSVGKRDDLAFAIDTRNDLFVFDIPRGSMDYLQYGILEGLKNKLVFSPKYVSTMKRLLVTPHVIVMCNERPDMAKLSQDRYKIINLHNLN